MLAQCHAMRTPLCSTAKLICKCPVGVKGGAPTNRAMSPFSGCGHCPSEGNPLATPSNSAQDLPDTPASANVAMPV
jgi:hypothetical protein